MKTIAARESTIKMPIPFITVTTAICPVSLVPFSNDFKGLLRLIFNACLQVSVQNIKKSFIKAIFLVPHVSLQNISTVCSSIILYGKGVV